MLQFGGHNTLKFCPDEKYRGYSITVNVIMQILLKIL
jgi:hypothetical protein